MAELPMNHFKNFIKKGLAKMNLQYLDSRTLELLETNRILEVFRLFSRTDDNELIKFMISHANTSRGQLFQDLLALFVSEGNNNSKEIKYFVEFGATDGYSLSNTYKLEVLHNWDGILAEPAKKWHHDLVINRNCQIDFRCVLDVSGLQIEFLETEETELSSIKEYSSLDSHSKNRLKNLSYQVETISFNDLLELNHAPSYIDYISIDTEGSEYKVLSGFDFEKYKVGLFTVEHNYTINESRIDALMEAKGYKRILSAISQWDAWYVSTENKYFNGSQI